jgi:hypothetical protein
VPSPPFFEDAFRERLLALLVRRRDVRRFRSAPLPAGAVEALLEKMLAATARTACKGMKTPTRSCC